jgi:hypothetical protein
VLKEQRLPYEKETVYILARSGSEYHIARIIGAKETSNPDSIGNASTRCLRYYKNHEYSIAEKEPARAEICRACLTRR